MALNLVKLRYIAEKVSKKEGYVVMFPDGSARVYHLTTVPMELQNAATREKYLKANKIEPCGILVIDEQGMLTLEDVTNPALQEKICALLENRFGIPYLLAHGYVTQEVALAMVATGFVSAEGLAPETAVRVSGKLMEVIKSSQRENFRNFLGVSSSQVAKLTGSPSEFGPAVPTPGNNENDAINTIEVPSKTLEDKSLVSNGNGRSH